MKGLVERFLWLQRRLAWLFLLIAIALGFFTAPRAIKLLVTVATDLIHLLPDHYPSVHYSNLIKQKFNKRSSLFLIISSPNSAANEGAALYAKASLEKLESVDFVENEKKGFDFINQYKLLLVDLEDIYKTRDRLKEKIQKKKLGGLYIDFEDDAKKDDVKFDDIIDKYKKKFLNGVQSRYNTNEDGTVYVLSIYPVNPDASVGYFKSFGQGIEDHVATLNLKQFGGDLSWGYAGAIRTRVDEYNALIDDLIFAGKISGISIFAILLLYFLLFYRVPLTGLNFLRCIVMVVLIFVPMVVSTFIGFWFCSFFFSHLNVVTSFLFSIIFGLGVDIGIHLINRYVHERHAGASPSQAHRHMLMRTGSTAAISILTTVASFYVLIFFDFKGFYDFGWIAGNGLVIALLTYLIFFPPLVVLADRLHCLIKMPADADGARHKPLKRPRLRFAAPALAFFTLITILSVIGVWRFEFMRVGFQYDFNTLKMKLAERVELKKKLKTTTGRVNSPAFYLIKNEIEARAIKKILEQRRAVDPTTTIEFFRSYYDLFPRDQEERLVVLKEIEVLLNDDVLTTLPKDEYDLVVEMRDSIKGLSPIREADVPVDLYEMFWGNTGPGAFWRHLFTIPQEDFLVMWGPRRQEFSVAFVSPLPQLELDNGQNAEAFYEDVHELKTLGNTYYAISDSIVFAEVLGTLFHDSRVAIVASLVLLIAMIFFHFRNLKRTVFVLLGLGFGFSWMLALMGLFDIRLNFYNMIVLPTMIGMGEDNSVHVIDRHDEFGHRSILHVLKISGGASLMASLTSMFGYAGLLFAHHPGLVSIGVMSIIGMGTCLVGSLVVLPLLAHLFLKPANGIHQLRHSA